MSIEPEKTPSILGQATSIDSNFVAFMQYLSFRKEGQYFLNQTVYLDDYTFVRCRFDNCKLVTNKGTFKFTQCFMANCSIVYGQEAYKIARLFNSNTTYANLYPQFQVAVNVDGTFTLE